jgi:hypothetical protein
MQTLQYYLTTTTHVFNVYRGPGSQSFKIDEFTRRRNVDGNTSSYVLKNISK